MVHDPGRLWFTDRQENEGAGFRSEVLYIGTSLGSPHDD